MNTYNSVERTQLTVLLPNQPGALRRLTGWLNEQSINMIGLQSKTQGDLSLVSFVPQMDDVKSLIGNLEKIHGSVILTPCFETEIGSEKGNLDSYLQHLGSSVNIRDIFITGPVASTPARVLFTVDSPEVFRTTHMKKEEAVAA